MLEENPPSENTSDRTTHDLRHEADAALKLYGMMQAGKPDSNPSSGIFELGMMLRVEISGSDVPLLLVPENDIVIGRSDPVSGISPEIDLSPFAAYQMGISRRHAIIRRQGTYLQLVDLGSRNGTYVNGKKAEPHQPVKLHNGDEMRLGKMALRVYFQEKRG